MQTTLGVWGMVRIQEDDVYPCLGALYDTRRIICVFPEKSGGESAFSRREGGWDHGSHL